MRLLTACVVLYKALCVLVDAGAHSKRQIVCLDFSPKDKQCLRSLVIYPLKSCTKLINCTFPGLGESKTWSSAADSGRKGGEGREV